MLLTQKIRCRSFILYKKTSNTSSKYSDSNNFQLLMRNIAELLRFAKIFEIVSTIVNYFYRSNKHITMLRQHQMRKYKQYYSITLSVITY
jgi:hypothetical protein